MVKDYFNGKEPLENINPDEIVAYDVIMSNYSKININDITTKAI